MCKEKYINSWRWLGPGLQAARVKAAVRGPGRDKKGVLQLFLAVPSLNFLPWKPLDVKVAQWHPFYNARPAFELLGMKQTFYFQHVLHAFLSLYFL